MLVCPQCQFENPNNNRVCQKCDTSLTHKPCHQCGNSVSFKDETCSHCGAFTGIVWRAIIAELGEGKPAIEESVEPEDYLDLARRYRLTIADEEHLSEALDPDSAYRVFYGKVVDCQPLQKSVLDVLVEQQTELGGFGDDGSEAGNNKQSSLWYQIGIPKLAQPYLALKKFAPIVPKVHDAWQEGKKEVILLSDRSQWQLLCQFWQTENLSAVEIVNYLQAMATCWSELVRVNCVQSLLIETNLRIDADKQFGLQQLYGDSCESQVGLPALGKMWQRLSNSLESSKYEPLDRFICKVVEGEIATVSDLLEQLAQLPEQLAVEAEVDARPSPENHGAISQSIAPEADAIAQSFDTEAWDEDVTDNLDDSPVVPSSDRGEQIVIERNLQQPFDSTPPIFMDEGAEDEDLSTAELPMQLYGLSDAGWSDVGRQRNHNEDCFAIKSHTKKHHNNRKHRVQARGLYILCDGMGGHAAGEVASAMAVERLLQYFKTHWREALPDRETINAGIALANQAIYEINQKNARHGNGRMGTTMAMALVQDMKLAIAHVGDSRIYRVNRKWGLEQLTVDHEVGQKAIQSGVDPKVAYARPGAHQLTQALGPNDDNFIQPDITFLDLHEDTLLLLCSDGLSDKNFVENHWETHLLPLIGSSTNLEEGVQKLIALGNEKNGHDNITAILVRIKVRPKFGMG